MSLEKKPFVNYTLEEDKNLANGKIFTIRLNEKEYNTLKEDMKILHQPKESTAMKTLAQIGRNVLHDQKTGYIMRAIFKNKVNNRRSGVEIFE